VLSLFLPVLTGVILALLFKSDALSYEQITLYFGVVNFRMIAIPSSAFDFYNVFFSTHDLTYFCQIFLLEAIRRLSLQRSVVARDGESLSRWQF